MNPISQDIDFVEYLRFLGNQESQHLTTFAEKAAEIEEYLVDGVQIGAMLPWDKTRDVFGFRPCEVSVWAGINGHGKSMVLSQVVLWLMRHHKTCIASLEMPIRTQAIRMMRQAAGCSLPSREFRRRFYEYTSDRVWLYDQTDTIESDRILGLCYYAARELGCTHIVIDSLMKCGLPADGNGHLTAQAAFIDALTAAAKSCKAHIHLVHHMRKGEDEEKRPGKFDLRGAAQISDLVDNVMIVHRNKRKERLVRQGEESSEPDATISVEKQRNGEWEGLISLWYDKNSQQYLPHDGSGPMPWPSPGEQWMLNRTH